MFGQVKYFEDAEWRAPHDLSGLVEEMFLDDARNAKGMLPSSDSSFLVHH
jgi:hypothetical protein